MTDPIQGVLGSSTAGGVDSPTGAKNGQAGSGAPAGVPGGGADSAEVGETRSLLETINATAAAVPTVNQGRVDALRQAITNGSYRVDPQQVARGLINSDANLPSVTATKE